MWAHGRIVKGSGYFKLPFVLDSPGSLPGVVMLTFYMSSQLIYIPAPSRMDLLSLPKGPVSLLPDSSLAFNLPTYL